MRLMRGTVNYRTYCISCRTIVAFVLEKLHGSRTDRPLMVVAIEPAKDEYGSSFNIRIQRGRAQTTTLAVISSMDGKSSMVWSG